MLIKLIRLLYYILFFVTPLIVFSHTSELFEFNKIILSYFIGILVIFLFAYSLLIKRVSVNRVNKLFLIPFLLFFLSQVVSTIFSIDVHTSLFGYYGRFNGGFLSLLTYYSLYFMFILIFNPQFLNTLLKISLFSSLAVMLWGLPGKLGHDLSCLVFTFQWGEGESFMTAFSRSFTNDCWTNQFIPHERLFSTLGQPNWLGAYLAINFFIGLYFYLRNTLSVSKNHQKRHGDHIIIRGKNTLLLGCYLLLNWMVILFTRSDSALFATIVSLVFTLGLLFLADKKLFSSGTWRILVLLVGMFALTIVFKTGIGGVDKYLTLQTYLKRPIQSTAIKQPSKVASPYAANIVTDSWKIRKIVWKGALELGKLYPPFGNGVETFAYAYNFVRPLEHNLTSEWDFIYNKAHNEYLNYFATTGYFGVITYIGIIFFTLGLIVIFLFPHSKLPLLTSLAPFIVRENTRLRDVKQTGLNHSKLLFICLSGSYMSILITNFFGFSVTVVNHYFYLIPAVFLGTLFYTEERGTSRQASPTHGWKRTLFTALLITLLLYAVSFVARYYIADILYAQSEQYHNIGDYQNEASLLNRSLLLHYEHTYEDKLSFALANLAFLTSTQKESDSTRKLVALSRYFGEKSLRASPKNVYYWKTGAKNSYLYYQINLSVEEIDKGIQALLRASTLASTDPKIPYSLALYYSAKEDGVKTPEEKDEIQEKALKAVNTAIQMKLNYEDAYYLKGQLLKKYGRTKEAREIFQFIIDKVNPRHTESLEELKSL